MQLLLLFASISFASGLAFVSIYTSMVDLKSWGGNIPGSIETAREYFRMVNPGNFFRIFSPLNQLLALLVLILFWRFSASARIYLGMAFALYVVTEVLTFAYFHPRNKVLLVDTPLPGVEILKNAWKSRTRMNWLRLLILITGLVFSCLALNEIYTGK